VIVLPLNTLKARRKRGEETGPAEPTDVQLLAEIRDLLADQGQSSTAGGAITSHHRSDERRV
jgi:large conductance mechanosensitive channel